MKNKKISLLITFWFSLLLSGCSSVPEGGYTDYTLGTNMKILGHAFYNFMFSLKMYNKTYGVILLVLLIAMLVTFYDDKKFNFFKHGFFTGIGIFLFINLFNPFLKTLSWIINLFTFN